MWWWIVVFAVLLALVILLFKRMPIEIIYAASAKYKKQAFRVKVYGINLIREKKDKHEKKPKQDDKEKKFSFDEFMSLLSRVKDIYKRIKDGVGEVLSYLGKKTQCKGFVIHLDLGFDDAAQTGIASGTAYGSIYSAASLVYNNLKMDIKDLDIEVNPHFDAPCASLYIKGIFRLSPAHIIRVIFMVLGIYKDVVKIIKE